MNTTVEKNNPKSLPKNEGKVNSRGMVAPPVPPRAPETKLSLHNELEKIAKPKKVAPPVPPKSYQAKFAGMKAIFERNAPHFQMNGSVSSNPFSPAMQKLMGDNASTLNKQRRDSGDSGMSSCSDISSSTLDKKAKTYNPLDWNPIYQGKKHFSLGNMSSNSSSCSEKSNISDISDKSNNSNIVRCNITRSNSKEDLRKPNATYNDKPTGKKLFNVNVKELIRKFEQNNEIIKGR